MFRSPDTRDTQDTIIVHTRPTVFVNHFFIINATLSRSPSCLHSELRNLLTPLEQQRMFFIRSTPTAQASVYVIPRGGNEPQRTPKRGF